MALDVWRLSWRLNGVDCGCPNGADRKCQCDSGDMIGRDLWRRSRDLY